MAKTLCWAAKTISKALEREAMIEYDTDFALFILLENFGTSTANIRICYWVNSSNFAKHIATLQIEFMYKVINALVYKRV